MDKRKYTFLADWELTVNHAGLQRILLTRRQSSELLSGAFSQRLVCLDVVYIPAGVLSLSAGLSEHICGRVVVSGADSGWSLYSTNRL